MLIVQKLKKQTPKPKQTSAGFQINACN